MMHKFDLTVYNEDIDYSGVVYHPNYIKFTERARLNWFETMGFGLFQQQNEGIYYVIRDIAIRYAKPARLDDRLTVRTTASIKGRAKARLLFHHEIDNVTQNQSTITTAEILVVCVDAAIKPRPLPDSIREALND